MSKQTTSRSDGTRCDHRGWVGSLRRWVVGALLVGFVVPASSRAQDEPGLGSKQQALSSRYSRFEKLLLQMAEYLGRTDPDRAELLMRALSRSREDRISTRMKGIVQSLQNDDFDDALEGQEQLIANLGALLELLQSEDRRSELEEETARIKKMLKDVNQLIGDQKITRAQAGRSAKPSDAIKSQQRVADKTQKVIDDAKAADDKKNQDAEPADANADAPKEGGDGKKPGEQDGKNPKQGDPAKQNEGDPPQGEPSQGEPKQGQPKNGKSPAQQSQGGESQESQQPEKKSPGREELEKARDAMNKALEQLKQDQKDGADARQDEAIQKLLDAKEKLEEKLRQLREEERELMLAALEARFQKMLVMQLAINAATEKLGAVDPEKMTDANYDQARQLAQLENTVGVEASKALAVLKEEGTSVSFPLAVEDMREDILTVARRLDDQKVGELTQEIQADIVEALEEMAEALKKEMEKGDEKQKQQQQGTPQNQQGDPVLVDLIAELKMLRTLQKRVNRRTRQIGRALDGEQAEEADLLEQLEKLAVRQDRIRRTAIDIERTRGEQK